MTFSASLPKVSLWHEQNIILVYFAHKLSNMRIIFWAAFMHMQTTFLVFIRFSCIFVCSFEHHSFF